VRASAVDAYSNGFHVVLVEECCFDRSAFSHKINLLDMHHKYADVMHVGEVISHLEASAAKKVKGELRSARDEEPTIQRAPGLQPAMATEHRGVAGAKFHPPSFG
jgi:hypothetical protein